MTKAETTKDCDEAPSVELAAWLADRVEIQDVRLLGSLCKQRPEEFKGKQTVTCHHRTQTKLVGDERTIVVWCAFKLTAVPEGGDSGEPSAALEATFRISYSIDKLDDVNERHLRSFGAFNGTYNAWPYFREFVQSMFARMGLPSLTLPVYRFGGRLSGNAADNDPTPETLQPGHADQDAG